MLYTVAKLTALLSGVAMAADHCVPHSDETEHIEDEDAHGPTLCWDVIHEMLPFCDVSEWPSLKLTNRHICQVIRERAFAETKTRFGDRFIGDYANYMREFEHGIVECHSIDQVIESVLFSRSNQMCFTPRFRGKLILYTPMVNRDHTKSELTFRTQPYCEIGRWINGQSQSFDNRDLCANNYLIGKSEGKPALMNIRTGKVTELPPCKEARFLNEHKIVLFLGDKFRVYDLFNVDVDFFGGVDFPLEIQVQWSATALRTLICQQFSAGIVYFTLDSDRKGWSEKTIKYKKSKQSELGFKQFLSPDGSVLIAIEIFKDKCSLVNIVDTHTETIRHTVMFHDYFFEAKMSRKGAFLRTTCDSSVLLDLNTGRWVRLTESHKTESFCWMGDSQFWFRFEDETGFRVCQIRSLADPFATMIEFDGDTYLIGTDLVYFPHRLELVRLRKEWVEWLEWLESKDKRSEDVQSEQSEPVRKLIAIVNGVPIYEDHSVPHSDETEHIEEESEPRTFNALLCPDVTGVILSFCDSTDWYSLKLLDRHMYRSINALIFGKWRSEIEKMIGDQSTMDAIGEGIIDCDSITQVKELVDFCETNKVCFTPRFHDKLIHFRHAIDPPVTSDSQTPLLKLDHVKADLYIPNLSHIHGVRQFSNHRLIAKVKDSSSFYGFRFVLKDILKGSIQKLPPCFEARFVDFESVALLRIHSIESGYYQFVFYNIFDQKCRIWSTPITPHIEGKCEWSANKIGINYHVTVIGHYSKQIGFHTITTFDEDWSHRKIFYERDEQSAPDIPQYLSWDGSIYLICEQFDDHSLVSVVDTQSGNIRMTVMIPFSFFESVKVSRYAAYFETKCKTGLFLDLQSGRLLYLSEKGQMCGFEWMGHSRFKVAFMLKDDFVMQIRSVDNPFTEIVDFESLKKYFYPLSSRLLYYVGGTLFRIVDDQKVPQSVDDMIDESSIQSDRDAVMRDLFEMSKVNKRFFISRLRDKWISESEMTQSKESKPKLTKHFQRFRTHSPIPQGSDLNQVLYHGGLGSVANEYLIGELNDRLVIADIKRWKVIPLPECKEARFVGKRTIVLFHGDKFQLYDLFDGEGDFFGEKGFPSLGFFYRWSVSGSTMSHLRVIICEEESCDVSYFELDLSKNEKWTHQVIKSGEGSDIRQILSGNGSILAALDEFDDCSLVTLIQTNNGRILKRVLIPLINVRDIDVGHYAVCLRDSSQCALILDLSTGMWAGFIGNCKQFWWLDSELFLFENVIWKPSPLAYPDEPHKKRFRCLKSMNDVYSDLIKVKVKDLDQTRRSVIMPEERVFHTVAELAALLDGVVITEPMDEESEPQSFTALLCPDVTGVILSFCDTTDWYSLKLLSRHMYRSINALIFGKWRSEIEKMIGDQSTMDAIGEGIIDCDSITQVKELVDFCETNTVCFTPRFCGKLIHFRRMIKQKRSYSKPTLRCVFDREFKEGWIIERAMLEGNLCSMWNSHETIGQLNGEPVSINLRNHKVTKLPRCKEARFMDDNSIVLFHRDKFQLCPYGNIGDFFGEHGFPVKFAQWSVTPKQSLVCEQLEQHIAYFTLENGRTEWMMKFVKYDKSSESDLHFRQFLSPDGSVLIAIERFKFKYSLVNIVDTRTESIRRTVFMPYYHFDYVKMSRYGLIFQTECKSVLLLNLKTGEWVRLIEPGQRSDFFWLTDSLFWLENSEDFEKITCHIRGLSDPFKDLIKIDGLAHPIGVDYVYFPISRKLMRLGHVW